MLKNLAGLLLFLASILTNTATAETSFCPGKTFVNHGIFLCYPSKAKYEGAIPNKCIREAREKGFSKCILTENTIPIPWSINFSENISRDVLEITIVGSSTMAKRISEEEIRSNWKYWPLCLIIALIGMVLGEMGSPDPNPKRAFPAYLGVMGCWMGLIYGFVLVGLILTIMGILIYPKKIKSPMAPIRR